MMLKSIAFATLALAVSITAKASDDEPSAMQATLGVAPLMEGEGWDQMPEIMRFSEDHRFKRLVREIRTDLRTEGDDEDGIEENKPDEVNPSEGEEGDGGDDDKENDDNDDKDDAASDEDGDSSDDEGDSEVGAPQPPMPMIPVLQPNGETVWVPQQPQPVENELHDDFVPAVEFDDEQQQLPPPPPPPGLLPIPRAMPPGGPKPGDVCTNFRCPFGQKCVVAGCFMCAPEPHCVSACSGFSCLSWQACVVRADGLPGCQAITQPGTFPAQPRSLDDNGRNGFNDNHAQGNNDEHMNGGPQRDNHEGPNDNGPQRDANGPNRHEDPTAGNVCFFVRCGTNEVCTAEWVCGVGCQWTAKCVRREG